MSAGADAEQRLAAALAPRIEASLVERIDALYETIGQLSVSVCQRDRVIARLRHERGVAPPPTHSIDDGDEDRVALRLHLLSASPLLAGSAT